MGTSGLGRLMVKEGLLSEQDRAIITKSTGSESSGFAKGILATGILNERELASLLATSTHFRVAPRDFLQEADPSAINLFPVPLLARLEVLPLRVESNILVVAMVDPLDKTLLRYLEFFSGYDVEPVIAPLSVIHAGLKSVIPDFTPEPSLLETFLSAHLPTSWQQLKMKHDFHLSPMRSHGGGSGPSHSSALANQDYTSHEMGSEDLLNESFSDMGGGEDYVLETDAELSEDLSLDQESDLGDINLDDIGPGNSVDLEDLGPLEDTDLAADGAAGNLGELGESGSSPGLDDLGDDLESLDVRDEFSEPESTLSADLSPADELESEAEMTLPMGDNVSLEESSNSDELGAVPGEDDAFSAEGDLGDDLAMEERAEPVSVGRMAALSEELEGEHLDGLREMKDEEATAIMDDDLENVANDETDITMSGLADDSDIGSDFEGELNVLTEDSANSLDSTMADESDTSSDDFNESVTDSDELTSMEDDIAMHPGESNLTADDGLPEVDDSLADFTDLEGDTMPAVIDPMATIADLEMDDAPVPPATMSPLSISDIVASLNQGLLGLSMSATTEEALAITQDVLSPLMPLGVIMVQDSKQPRLITGWQSEQDQGVTPLKTDDLKEILASSSLWQHVVEQPKQGWITGITWDGKSRPLAEGTVSAQLVMEDLQQRKIVLVGHVYAECVQHPAVEDLVTRTLGLLSSRL